MNCSETKELLSAFLDGELSHELRESVRRHAQECASCGEELASFSAIAVLAKQLPHPVAPPDIWPRLSQELEAATPRSRTAWLMRDARRTYSIVGLLAAAVLLLTGIMLWSNRHMHSEHSGEAGRFAQFARSFPDDPEGAQQLLLASYESRAVGKEELSNSAYYTATAASQPPDGYAFQQAYSMKMACCECSQVVLRRQSGGHVAIFEHGAVEHPDWMSGLRCTNMQCGTTRCEVAQTGEYLAVSCHVADRHFTIVGATGKSEVEALVAWLQAAGSSARGDKSREVS
jgi:hypothetical protein